MEEILHVDFQLTCREITATRMEIIPLRGFLVRKGRQRDGRIVTGNVMLGIHLLAAYVCLCKFVEGEK